MARFSFGDVLEAAKRILAKRLRLGTAASIALIAAVSLLLTYFVFLLQPFPSYLMRHVLAQSGPVVVWLNFLPIFLCMLALYFAINNFVVSAGTVGFAVIALSVLNRFKIIFRHDPLSTWDFVLGAEVQSTIRSFSPRLIFGTLGGFALIVAVIIIAAFFVRNKKMHSAFRIVGLGLSGLGLVAAVRTTLADEELFSGLYVHGSEFRAEDNFNSRGFLYAFIHTHLVSEISRPSGFSSANVEEWVAELIESRPAWQQPEDTGQLPHVWMILSEAFSEIALSPYLHFNEGYDPMANYRRLLGESRWGHLVVPSFGGGTADTEFDILTGINTRQFREMAFSYRMITRTFPGLVDVLNNAGYFSQALHPGWAWFYNRANVFEFLGFENFKTFYDFDPPPVWRGGFPSDESVSHALIQRLEEHMRIRPGVPLFEFVITVQNHGPFPGKFPDVLTDTFTSSLELSESDINALNNYFHGIRYTNIELARLTDYANTIDEPIVIVFFGDHLPSLPRPLLDSLLTGRPRPDELLEPNLCVASWQYTRLFTVPFLIWSNEAARSNTVAEPSGRLMGSYHFGAYVLEYIGLGYADPFFAFLNELRIKYPLQLEHAYFDPQGEFFRYDDYMSDSIRLHRHWSYHRLFG